jgi:hypothetical protein
MLPLHLAALLLAVSSSAASPKTTEDRLQEFGEIVRARLAPRFEAAHVPFPPGAVTLIGLKQERTLQVYAAAPRGRFRYICSYPFQAASGELGPKLRRGDKQVPEGLYAVEKLNPNSKFHLALRVNYPNAFDRARAAEDGRIDLGGDIMIHGNLVSVGCLAMGDPVAEDLFILAALTGPEHVRIILSPVDFRMHDIDKTPPGSPSWLPDLYRQIKAELRRYPEAPSAR